MNCVASLFKYIMFLVNIIFMVCGILLIVLGALMMGKMGDVGSFNQIINLDTIPILIIVLGSIVFVVSFFGCCGAICENVCFMTTYSVLMFILFCLQVALVVWVFVKRQNFLNAMSDAVDTAWNTNEQAQGYPMDALQIGFNCCGRQNYADYGGNVPSSCCGTMSGTCVPEVYQQRPGCSKAFRNFWATNTNIIRWAGIGVAAVELVAFTLGICLASSMRKSKANNM